LFSASEELGLSAPLESAGTKIESGGWLVSNKSIRGHKPQAPTSAESQAHKALACLQAIPQNLKLFGELVTLRTDLLRFSCNPGDLVGGHVKYGDGGQNAVQGRNQLGLDYFDGHIVNEPLESNLESESRS
jgi:hypothetical protein